MISRTQEHVLRILVAEGPCNSFHICRVGAAQGARRPCYSFEWADAPLRALRNAGLAEKTGEKISDRAVHRATAEGMALIERVDAQWRVGA